MQRQKKNCVVENADVVHLQSWGMHELVCVLVRLCEFARRYVRPRQREWSPKELQNVSRQSESHQCHTCFGGRGGGGRGE